MYWLMKSEPDAYSLDDLQRERTTCWDGIRNYQVRNMMRERIQIGDLAFFYYSNIKEPGIAGIMEVVSGPYPDAGAFDPESRYYDPKSEPAKPRWLTFDVRFKSRFKRFVALSALRSAPKLHNMAALRKGNRLSITPVTATEWQLIRHMGEHE